jgi:16S rRNA A1518/A1519 N6-dimethyltransferase RsmA/KsgA/DIM1 with predicted DNA glycosylase/AP lyase activity
MKDIKGFEGLYSVTSCGKVYSHISERFLIPQKKKSGYFVVNLCRDGKIYQISLHRIVAEAYIPNPNNYEQVNHINEIKSDNYIRNLEWCDAKYNANFGTRNKRISEKQTNNTKMSRKVLCVETGETFPSTHEVERKLGIYHSEISKCCNGKRKTAGGYTFEYVEDDD